MPDNELKCAIYCRVARDDETAPGEAIERQRQIILAYAREMGYTETADYLDNGYSGLNTDRPAFAKLNADISAGKVKAVIVKDLSRIGRDYLRCTQWFSRMDKLGVTVLCHDTQDYQKQLNESHAEFAPLYKRKRRKQERHTVRTPPPPKSR